MKKYRINEIFLSVQGEGRQVGTLATFVRFSGCNLACPYCDTKHEEFKEMTSGDIAAKINKSGAGMVVLTGGEPGLQIDAPFMEMLKKKTSAYIALETNGTCRVPSGFSWITCSPKKETRYAMAVVPNEIKIVWDKAFRPQEIAQFNHPRFNVCYKYLQPESNEPRYIENIIEYMKSNPQWRLSLQCQKLIGIM